MRIRAGMAAACLCATTASACETALLLAIDVSNSIDPGEYRIQRDGLAAALRDGVVVEAMMRGANAVAVMQWSGKNMQAMSIPWRRIGTGAEMLALADAVEAMPRAHIGSNTAIGEALRVGVGEILTQGDCARLIIDVSGDGPDNAGTRLDGARALARSAGITVNGLAIDGLGAATTTYYERRLVTPDGFVETANGFSDFPRAIRAKIRREVSRVTG
ncbi:MAG: DUF1194 domain-containing protein [Deinococcus-Thermus bacterium]|nr:DUF1194 domain-containing protein [Deinococcota bacterium]